MDILVIGGGGREHAIIQKLRESRGVGAIYAAPGNGGIASDAICVDLAATDIEGIVSFARAKKIDYVVVAPDDPLVLGLVDALKAAGIDAFGPSRSAALLEGSKAFAKQLMQKYGIPTARYAVFEDAPGAIAYLREQNRYPTVIKADGLALGKGVVIAKSEQEAVAAVRSMMEEGKFGVSGRKVVIEEFLQGIEVSVLSFTDGKTVVPMVSSMDHKRAHDRDTGPNTGGMGTIAPHPLFTKAMEQRCMEEIFLPTIRAMQKEGRAFHGCLYFGLMLCQDGPRVIEYNCRFGDPETQVVLPLLEGDLLSIMISTGKGTLSEQRIGWKPGAAACVVVASGGYPEAYEKGFVIHGLGPEGQAQGVTVYHAGTKCENGVFKSNGGRVLGITAVGGDLPAALQKAYRAVETIGFSGSFYRRDIGEKAMAAKGR